MGKVVKFNNPERQLYLLGRNVLRKNEFPELPSDISISAIRARGVRDEDIAFMLACPVEDVEKVILFDQETNRVVSATDKIFKTEFKALDKIVSSMDVTITTIGNRKR